MPGLSYHQCEALRAIPGIKHGFFERSGGVSEGPFGTLNCARLKADSDETVLENRRRAMKALGLEGKALVLPKQEHGVVVHVVDRPWSYDQAPPGDGLVTAQQDIALGILTADCGPVLFADPVQLLIGACHAGWKGAFHGILEQTVETMEHLGSHPCDIIACLGPCIHQTSYEVDSAFYQHVEQQNPAFKDYFQKGDRKDHFFFDLPGYIVARLHALGLARVDQIQRNTYSGNFFSCRRSFHQGSSSYGCQLSLIMIGSDGIFV